MTAIRELFERDEIAAGLGIELLDVGATHLRLSVGIDERHVGWHGRCHGGVLFTVADVAMSYLGNRFDALAYATHASIEFLRGVEPGDLLEVEAVERWRRGRSAMCDVTMRVGDDVVAEFRGATLQLRA